MNSSRRCEAEADFMALYLLKRAGYDINLFGETLRMLNTSDLSAGTLKFFAMFEDHPSIPDREKCIDMSIAQVEKDFEENYCVEEKKLQDTISKSVSRGMDYVWAFLNLFI